MTYEEVKKWRKKNKERMVEAFGGCCGICGYSKCTNALEFHHLDPKEKDFNVTNQVTSWKKAVEELRKCVMLCSNCHKEIHDGIEEIPENIKRFDESFAVRNYKKDEMSPCLICMTPKPKMYKTCSHKCSAKLSRKVDWDNVDLGSLLEEHKSFTKVGKILGISDSATRKRARKIGLI